MKDAQSLAKVGGSNHPDPPHMHSSRLLLASLAAVLLLTGCASAPPSRQALNPALQARITSTDVIVGIPQGLLFVQQPANPTAGTNPQAEVMPLRAALQGSRFDQQLRAALDPGLRKLTRLSPRPALLQPQASEAVGAARLQASSADAVLLVTASYSMSPDFSRLELGLRATLMPRSATLRKAAGLKPKLPTELRVEEALYRNTLVFRSRLPDAGSDPLSNRAQWLVDDAYPLRQAIDDGLVEVVAALTEDLRTKPGINSIGPALTDGYQRQRAANGTLSISGLASSGRPVQVEVVAPATTLDAPTAIEAPPPAPEAEPTHEMVEPGLIVPLAAEADTAVTDSLPSQPASAADLTLAPPSRAMAEAPPSTSASDAGAVATAESAHIAEPLPPASAASKLPSRSLSMSQELAGSPELPLAPSPAVPLGPTAPAASAATRRSVTPVIAPVAPTPPSPATAPAARDEGLTRLPTPLRLRPTAISPASSTLPPGTAIRLLGRTRNTTGEWLYVQGPSDSGWARSEEVQLNP